MKSAEAEMSNLDLRCRLDAVYEAHLTTAGRDPGDIPSTDEIRDLLRLYARLQHEDLRHAVLCLLRTIVGPMS